MSQCEFHGYDKLGCPGCRASALEYAKANDHGVFVWRGDGRYASADSLKTYRRECDANKYAEKLNQTNPVHVVRTVKREAL